MFGSFDLIPTVLAREGMGTINTLLLLILCVNQVIVYIPIPIFSFANPYSVDYIKSPRKIVKGCIIEFITFIAYFIPILTLFLAGYLIPTDRGGGGGDFRPALLKL